MAAGLVDAAILQLAVATILRRNRGVSLRGSCAPEFQLGVGGLYPYIFQIGFTWSNAPMAAVFRETQPLWWTCLGQGGVGGQRLPYRPFVCM